MPPQTPHSGDRRPIAARSWRFSQIATQKLVRCGLSPNGISLIGMLCGIAAGLCFAATRYLSDPLWPLWLGGALCVQLRLLANMLDGMVAIESGRTSSVGELFNEIPDRVSDSAILIGLGYSAGAEAALGYFAALLAMSTAYIRCVGKACGAKSEFCGPMAKQHRMFIVTVVATLCGFVPLCTRPLWEGHPSCNLASATLFGIGAGCLFTALRRLSRIAHSLRNRPV